MLTDYSDSSYRPPACLVWELVTNMFWNMGIIGISLYCVQEQHMGGCVYGACGIIAVSYLRWSAPPPMHCSEFSQGWWDRVNCSLFIFLLLFWPFPIVNLSCLTVYFWKKKKKRTLRIAWHVSQDLSVGGALRKWHGLEYARIWKHAELLRAMTVSILLANSTSTCETTLYSVQTRLYKPCLYMIRTWHWGLRISMH